VGPVARQGLCLLLHVGDRRRLCGDLAEGLTPLTAAAQGGYYEIVQMLLQRGHVVTRPHIALCECEECVRVEKTLEVLYYLTAYCIAAADQNVYD